MKRIAFLEQLSPWGKFLLLLAVILLFAIISALTGLLIGKILFGIDIANLEQVVSNPETDSQVLFIKVYQLINQIGVFILPAILFTILVSHKPLKYLQANRSPNITNLLVMGLVVFAALPFLNYLGELNQDVVLPSSLGWLENWMLDKEIQAKELTEAFLKTNTVGGLLFNLFIIAVIPALGEELLFRGLILKLFKEISRSSHLAVVLSALIFAAIHMQFYGFLPRFFLGIVLGYSFVITQNLWIPVFIHFVNNAASVIVFYLHQQGFLKIPMEDFGSSQNPVYIIGSLLITIWLMIIVNRREGHFIKT